jgi:hypothetical protein
MGQGGGTSGGSEGDGPPYPQLDPFQLKAMARKLENVGILAECSVQLRRRRRDGSSSSVVCVKYTLS